MDVAKLAFHSEDTVDDEDECRDEGEASPKAVGHNIFILAHQVTTSYNCYIVCLVTFLFLLMC